MRAAPDWGTVRAWPKESLRVEAYGSVDETNSAVGLVLAVPALPDAVKAASPRCSTICSISAGELCIPGHRMITAAYVDRLERELDGFNEALPPLKDFILPGGGPAAAACHMARAICRRAERRCWSLARVEPSRPTRSNTSTACRTFFSSSPACWRETNPAARYCGGTASD